MMPLLKTFSSAGAITDSVSAESAHQETTGSSQRSTSAGASPRFDCGDDGLPVVQHRSPLRVKNTFIDESIGRPISLEGFFEERAVCSCPASRLASFDDAGMPGIPSALEELLESIAETISTVPECLRNEGALVLNDVPPLRIKNTFIDNHVGRPTSLEGFLFDRTAFSCPVSRSASIDDEAALQEAELCCDVIEDSVSQAIFESPQLWPAAPRNMREGMPLELEFLLAGLSPVQAGSPASLPSSCVPPPPPHAAPLFSQDEAPPPPRGSAPQVQPLQLSTLPATPELASAVLPTVGSVGHSDGSCKPCAFFHTKGCSNATSCVFCHLCPEGERKLRAKERKAAHKGEVVSRSILAPR